MSGLAQSLIREVEADTHRYYRERHVAFGDRGYHVMYAPPIMGAPIAFVGYQPGGHQRTADHLQPEPRNDWPSVALYATESWPLARGMREMFGTELLEQCTGLNAIFFRSPNIATYTKEVDLKQRRDASRFCASRVRLAIAELQPRLVVAIGFDTLRLLGAAHPLLSNSRGRTLLMQCEIGGIPAIGTLHLSGARISATDREAMAHAILARVKAT